jgi:hypothetical protein
MIWQSTTVPTALAVVKRRQDPVARMAAPVEIVAVHTQLMLNICGCCRQTQTRRQHCARRRR